MESNLQRKKLKIIMTGSIETITHQTLPGLPNGKITVSKYIVTPSGNKVSKEAVIYGSQNIVLQGNVIVEKDCMIRGNCVIRPPFKHYTKGFAFFPMSIGAYSYIGENSIINSNQIGNYVEIGKDVILGKRTIIRDCVVIEDGVVLPDDTHIPPFTRVKKPFLQVHNDVGYTFKNTME